MNLRVRSTMTAPAIEKVVSSHSNKLRKPPDSRRHLGVMGCQGLMEIAWRVKEENFVMELIGTPDNKYDGTLQAHPEFKRVQEWKTTYDFRDREVKVVKQRDKNLNKEFAKLPNPNYFEVGRHFPWGDAEENHRRLGRADEKPGRPDGEEPPEGEEGRNLPSLLPCSSIRTS